MHSLPHAVSLNGSILPNLAVGQQIPYLCMLVGRDESRTGRPTMSSGREQPRAWSKYLLQKVMVRERSATIEAKCACSKIPRNCRSEAASASSDCFRWVISHATPTIAITVPLSSRTNEVVREIGNTLPSLDLFEISRASRLAGSVEGSGPYFIGNVRGMQDIDVLPYQLLLLVPVGGDNDALAYKIRPVMSEYDTVSRALECMGQNRTFSAILRSSVTSRTSPMHPQSDHLSRSWEWR